MEHSDENARKRAEAAAAVTDWDQELKDIRSLYEPAPVLPPKPAAPAKKAQKKRRPAYQPAPQYDHAVTEKESFFARHRTGILVALFALIFAFFLGMLCFAISKLSGSDSKGDTILKHVSIAGIDVGRMTREEAEQALRDSFSQWEMVVSVNGTELVLTPQISGVTLDIPGVVDEAMDYGHGGSKLAQLEAYADSLSGSHDIGLLPYLELNREGIRSRLDGLGDSFRQSAYSLSGEFPALSIDQHNPMAQLPTLVLDLGCPGQGLDTDALMAQILAAYDEGKTYVEAAAQVTTLLPQALDLDAVYQAVCMMPSKESYGCDFDVDSAKAAVDAAQTGDVLRISMRYLEPLNAATSADFPDVLSSCDTPHNQDVNRNSNMELVCQMLNGLVIQPGEVFSFNEAVGERSMERGFLCASVYSNYSQAQPVGGGVIQNASSLYLCAMLADLEILERESAQFQPGFVDPGMDAEVGWPGPDLKFRNNTDHPIKILCRLDDSSLSTQLLGTDNRDCYVKMEYQISNFESPIVYQDVAAGTYENGAVIQRGVSGAYVQTYRCKYSTQTNECISREPEAASNYPATQTTVARVVSAPEEPAA